MICHIRDLVRELRGERQRPGPPQQETRSGIVLAFLGVPCEFGDNCAYPGLGWRCGHLRQQQEHYVEQQEHYVGCRTWNTGCDGDCDCRSAR